MCGKGLQLPHTHLHPYPHPCPPHTHLVHPALVPAPVHLPPGALVYNHHL
jgi:hypothetical protein